MRIQGKYYARLRRKGVNEFGPARSDRFDAEADLREIVRRASVFQPGHPLTFGEWAFRQSMVRSGLVESGSLSAAQFDTEETCRLRHIEGTALERKRLSRIRREDIEEWIDGLRLYQQRKVAGEVQYVRTKERPSANTVRKYVAIVSRLLSEAKREGLVHENFAIGVKLPRVLERPNRVLSPEEAAGLLDAQDRTDAMIVVLLLTGMRRSELVRLEWKHIEDGWIVVPGSKSAKAPARAPLPATAAHVIEQQPRRSKYVFTTETGRPISPWNLTRDVKKRLLERGLPEDMRLQDLRGSFISLLFESGADLRTAQELGRHADPKTTMSMYARSRAPRKKGASDAMERLLKMAGGKEIGLVPGDSASDSGELPPDFESGALDGN